MSSIQTNDTQVLRNANAGQLEQAIAENHRQLFCLNAMALGGTVNTIDGLTYTHTTFNGSAVVFPSFTPGHVKEQLDAMMDFYREQGAENIGYWSLDPPDPADVGASLLARGFQPGWQPCWMSLDLGAIQTGFAASASLEIRADNDTPVQGVEGLPYAGNGGALSDALFRTYPHRVQRFLAFLDGIIVGQCCLFFSTGPQAIAGMYNVGVIPPMQKQGIGKALVVAACQYAKRNGFRYVMLNANHIGRRTYEQVGFRFIGYGCTWWLMNKTYITHPPSPALVALAEATGKGDIDAMEKAAVYLDAATLNAPLTNGMSLLQLAAHCGQSAAADWLVGQGATYTALDAWELGWKERAAQLLATQPGEVNRQYGEWQSTLMHIASERDDTALAQLALEAGADLTIHDKIAGTTAIGWAHYFKRPAIIALINQYQQDKSK